MSTTAGPEVGARRAVRVVEAASQLGGRLRRFVGSVDYKGQGTEYAITDVGPFVLVGEASGLEGRNLPPFGRHPHAGLLAISFVPGGGSWTSVSNAPGFEELPFESGDVLLTNAGRGVVHDEVTSTDGTHELVQIILRLPHRRAGDAAWVERRRPTRVSDGVLCLFDAQTLERLEIEAAGHHCTLRAGGRAHIEVPAGHTTGYVYARRGEVSLRGVAIREGHVAVLSEGGATLELMAGVQGPAEALIGTAAENDEPWAKLLGHNGFVIGPDAASVEAMMAQYQRDPESFGLAG